jgi:glycosyltransferase involved in cell wall biosynthesis
MRIVIDARKIADFGIGTYIRGLLSGLAAAGDDHQYIVLAPESATPHIPRDSRFRMVIDRSPHYSLREMVAIGRRVAAERADLFHATHYVTPFTTTPMVVTIHDLIHLHHPMRNRLAPTYAKWMIGRAVRRSRRVLTVSQTVAGQLAIEFPGSAGKTVVTPNGVDRSLLDVPVSGDDSARERFGLYRGAYVLFVGNDKPHKNVGALIDAWRGLRRLRADLRLVLAGGAFERFTAEERVVRVGFVSINELAALYRGALCVVVPSREEGFGLPAAEAMALGAPVITSTAPALVEVTSDAALHVDARDSDALARAIAQIAQDASFRETMIQRGRQRAMGFSWERCAAMTLDAYGDAMR